MIPPSVQTLLVGSGKGGVGKSTVAVNLAVALAKRKYKVGLLDADLFGPSIPIMLGLRGLSPRIYPVDRGKDRVIPFSKFGVLALSVGFFLNEPQSLPWRGPMLHGLLEKLLNETHWGKLDYLLIDLPPGTGDVPLSLSQLLQITGAIVVTTPQEVAIVDAVKAINCYAQLTIPLLGVCENMSGFTPDGGKEMYPIFGSGLGKALAKRFDTHFLGEIPLDPKIRMGSDQGIPECVSNPHSLFHSIAETICESHKVLSSP